MVCFSQLVCGAVFALQLWTAADAVVNKVNPTSVVLEVYGDSGYFLSPYFPSKYHANHNLTYTAYLDTPGPLTLRLVLQLDLESDRNICYDYVKIYDIKYCGQGSLTKDIQINGSEFVMGFVSDDSFEKYGFNVSYSVLRESVPETPPLLVTTPSTTAPTTVSTADITTTNDVTTTTEQKTTDGSVTPDSIADADTTIVVTPYGARSETTEITTETPLPETTLSTTAPTTVSASDVTTKNDVTTTTEPKTTNGSVTPDSIADADTTIVVTPSEARSDASSITEFSAMQSTATEDTRDAPGVSTLAEVTSTGSRDDVTATFTSGGRTSPEQSPASTTGASRLPLTLTRPRKSCRCVADTKRGLGNGTTMTQQQQEDLVALVKTLTVNKHNISASWRRHNSVDDSRHTAVAMGMVGIIVCAVPLLFVLATDVLGMCAQGTAERCGVCLHRQ